MTSQPIPKAFSFDVLVSGLLPGGAAHIKMGLHRCAQGLVIRVILDPVKLSINTDLPWLKYSEFWKANKCNNCLDIILSLL